MLAHRLRRAMAGGAPTSLTFVGVTTANTGSTVAIHGSAVAGDLAILFDQSDTNATGVYSEPTGFDVIASGESGAIAGGISAVVLTAGHITAGTITGMSGAGAISKALVIYRPDAPITNILFATPSVEYTTGNPAAQNIAASGGAVPLVAVAMAANRSGTSSFSTNSPALTTTAINDLIAGYLHYNSSPSDHSVDMNDLGVNGLLSNYIWVE